MRVASDLWLSKCSRTNRHVFMWKECPVDVKRGSCLLTQSHLCLVCPDDYFNKVLLTRRHPQNIDSCRTRLFSGLVFIDREKSEDQVK